MKSSLLQLPFDRLTAAKGHQLYQSGAVRRLFGDPTRIEAHVRDPDGHLQTVTFAPVGDGAWSAACTCVEGAQGGCPHAHAAMLSVQESQRRRETLPPPPHGTRVDAGVQEAVFRHGLERAFAEFRRRRAVTNEILALVQPDWPDDTFRAWSPWPADEPPVDPQGLWQYLALALNEAGFQIPEFMRPVTRLAETAADIQRTATRAETERWEKAIHAFTAATPLGRPERVELRLALRLPGEGRLEWRPALAPATSGEGTPDEPVFREVEKEDLQRFMALGRQSLLVPAGGEGASVLWLTYLHHWQQTQELGMDLSLPRLRKTLNGLFSQPATAPFVVNAEGQPFRRGAPLRWVLHRSDDGVSYLLRLAAEGELVPVQLLHLPGATPLYLSAEAVHEGPATGNFVAGDQYQQILPAAVVEGRTGIELLHRLGVEPPEHLRDKIRVVPMHVELVCELETKGFKLPHEELTVLARAVAEDGSRVEILTRDQWVVEDHPSANGHHNSNGHANGSNGHHGPKAGTPIPLYDRALLAHFPALLERVGLKPGRFEPRWRRRVEHDFPAAFAAWLRELPPGVTATLADPQLQSLRLGVMRPKVSFSLRPAPGDATDWFDVSVDLDAKDTRLTAAELRQLLRARGGYVRLKGKGWRRLELDLDVAMQGKLAQLGLDPEDFATGPQRLHVLQLTDPAVTTLLDPAKAAALRARCEALLGQAAAVELPLGITAELRPYQLDGFRFLARLARAGLGGILADDMGLGKTVQALVWLTWLRAQNDVLHPPKPEKLRRSAAAPTPSDSLPAPDPSTPTSHLSPLTSNAPPPSLVVCPKSVMENWAREAAKFAPGLRVRVVHPRPGGRLPEPDPASADLFVVNYAQLRRRADFYLRTKWLAVILDEGQNIKNPDSQSARTVRALEARHRLVLTGTPIENRLLDLWSLMAFATPGILGQRAYFERQFEKRDDPHSRQRIAARLRPFLLRRTKKEVAPDLPPRIEEDWVCEMDGAQLDLYRGELKRARGLLLGIEDNRHFNEQRFHILQSLLRLRQIACHPGLLDPSQRGESSAKLEALLDLLEPLREEGHKVLVFSQFVSMLDILREHLDARGWTHFTITGQTEDRAAVVDAFSESPEPAVFLLSLKAAGSGLNLMAASYVVLFDPWWNPAVEAQAIDRTHRIGQANQVMAYRLIVKDSVEEKIRALQAKKANLALDVLGVNGDGSAALDWRDFEYLLADDEVE